PSPSSMSCASISLSSTRRSTITCRSNARLGAIRASAGAPDRQPANKTSAPQTQKRTARANLDFARALPAQTEVTVAGLHFLQEDSPDEIGRPIASWMGDLQRSEQQYSLRRQAR